MVKKLHNNRWFSGRRFRSSAILACLLVLAIGAGLVSSCQDEALAAARASSQKITESLGLNNQTDAKNKTATSGPTAAAGKTAGTSAGISVPATSRIAATTAASQPLTVHFIDVGQADSILIQQGSSAMLIDGGNQADAGLIINYLEKHGVSQLDYVIATHPHEDHIGGLDEVIAHFKIGKVILPNATTNTIAFMNLLYAIQDKGLKATRATAGNSYQLGSATWQILGPNGTLYDDTNDYSVVTRLTFGKTSFLFMGDAETKSESEILAAGFNLRANVLKVGHHGSTSSTSPAFLRAVNPDSAVISVGADNSYGHPSAGTLGALLAAAINIYRTDLAGTIVATSNGTRVTFNKQPNAGQAGSTTAATTAATVRTTTQTTRTAQATTANNKAYIGNINTLKFHRPTCSYLPDLKNRCYFSTRSSAISAGYVPCARCKP